MPQLIRINYRPNREDLSSFDFEDKNAGNPAGAVSRERARLPIKLDVARA